MVELLRGAGLGCPITGVTITGGDKVNGYGVHVHVPKKDLMSSLLVLLEQGELKIPRHMKEAGTLVRELNAIQMKHKPGGRVQMGAEGSGQHDDLVLAVALACWRARGKEIGYGTRSLW